MEITETQTRKETSMNSTETQKHFTEHLDEYVDGCPICEDEQTASDLAGTRSGSLAHDRVEAARSLRRERQHGFADLPEQEMETTEHRECLVVEKALQDSSGPWCRCGHREPFHSVVDGHCAGCGRWASGEWRCRGFNEDPRATQEGR